MLKRTFSSLPLPPFSHLSLRRKPSPIRSLMPLLKLPGMISLGGGMPNINTFPFEEINFKLKNSEAVIKLNKDEMNDGIQYSASSGLPILIKLLKEMQINEHKPLYNDWNCFITVGSQDGITKVFEMLLNPEDSIYIESPSYPGILSFLQPYKSKFIEIKTDKYGIIPESLELLCKQNVNNQPKVLYTIPTGQNPSGATLNTERKKKIYELACKYNFIIMEDDPYYFLSYGEQKAKGRENTFKRSKIDSFLSMDNEGRVLRFDSFSKVLGGGLRIGWVTGHNKLLNQLELHQQATLLHNCGLSQAIVAKLLQTMGTTGWNEHVRKVALFYCARRDALIAACEKHLKGLARWDVPEASMFLWIELLTVKDSHSLITAKAVDAKVLFIPGQSCSPTNSVSNFVRASFSTATDEEMDIAMERLAKLLKSQ